MFGMVVIRMIPDGNVGILQDSLRHITLLDNANDDTEQLDAGGGKEMLKGALIALTDGNQ